MGIYFGNKKISTTFDEIYPIGSVYTSTNGTHPQIGTWEQLDTETTLWNTDSGGGGTLSGNLPLLPTITSTFSGNTATTSSDGAHTHIWKGYYNCAAGTGASCIYITRYNGSKTAYQVALSAGAHTHTITPKGTVSTVAANDSVYKASQTTIQPPAIAVTMFKRVA